MKHNAWSWSPCKEKALQLVEPPIIHCDAGDFKDTKNVDGKQRDCVELFTEPFS